MHHLTAIPTVITLLIMLGFQQRLTSFVFLKISQKGMFGLFWSNEERTKNSIRITETTPGFEKHFLPEKIYKPLRGTQKWLIQGARPILHPWNNFVSIEKHWKESMRPSPRRKAKVQDCSEQHDDDVYEWMNEQMNESIFHNSKL